MSNKIQINIATPCHENWDQMNPIEQGRFCNSCNKAVIDFTNMSDRELAQFFKKPSTGGTCGRFLQEQLDRDITVAKKRLPWLRYFFQVAIPAMFLTKQGYSQGTPRLAVSEQKVDSPVKRMAAVNIKGQLQHSKLAGRIIDASDGLPVPYVTIRIKGSLNIIAADSAGYFSFEHPIFSGQVTLELSSIGYETIEEVYSITNAPLEIIMRRREVQLEPLVVTSELYVRRGCSFIAGGVNITQGVVISEDTTWKKVKSVVNWFAPTTRPIIFPNPVQRGRETTIELQNRSDEQLKIVVQTANGDVVNSLQYRLTKGTNRLQLPTSRTWAAGIYFIRFFNKKDKRVAVEKIVVH